MQAGFAISIQSQAAEPQTGPPSVTASDRSPLASSQSFDAAVTKILTSGTPANAVAVAPTQSSTDPARVAAPEQMLTRDPSLEASQTRGTSFLTSGAGNGGQRSGVRRAFRRVAAKGPEQANVVSAASRNLSAQTTPSHSAAPTLTAGRPAEVTAKPVQERGKQFPTNYPAPPSTEASPAKPTAAVSLDQAQSTSLSPGSALAERGSTVALVPPSFSDLALRAAPIGMAPSLNPHSPPPEKGEAPSQDEAAVVQAVDLQAPSLVPPTNDTANVAIHSEARLSKDLAPPQSAGTKHSAPVAIEGDDVAASKHAPTPRAGVGTAPLQWGSDDTSAVSAADTPHTAVLTVSQATSSTAPVPQATGPQPPQSAAHPSAATSSAIQPGSPATQIGPALMQMGRAPDGAQRLTVRLDPGELGQVQIKIDRPIEGSARVEITVQKPETLNLLLRDQSQLQRALDQAGVPAEGRTVTLHIATPETSTRAGPSTIPLPSTAAGGPTGDGSFGAARQPGQPASQRRGTIVADDSTLTEVTASPATRWLRAGLDITA